MPLGVVSPFWVRHIHIVRAQPQARIVDKRGGGSVGERYLQMSKAEEAINLT